MKTLKAMMMGMALLLICGASQAKSLISPNNSKDQAIDTYLNAVVHGKLAGIDDAIDNEAQFDMRRGNNVNTLTKAQIISSLKANENIEQDCQCTKTVVRDDDDMKVMKVDMKYNDFTRTDVITTEHSGSGWKITKVETSFK
jgi:hypothetical protein